MIEGAVITDAGAIADLDAFRVLLNDGRVALWDNNFNPTKASVLADFNEASFVGYASISPAGFAAAFLNGDGKAETDSAVLLWTFTAGSGTAVVYGWMVIDQADAEVLAFQKFLSPVVLTPGSPNLSRVIQIGAVSEQL